MGQNYLLQFGNRFIQLIPPSHKFLIMLRSHFFQFQRLFFVHLLLKECKALFKKLLSCDQVFSREVRRMHNNLMASIIFPLKRIYPSLSNPFLIKGSSGIRCNDSNANGVRFISLNQIICGNNRLPCFPGKADYKQEMETYTQFECFFSQMREFWNGETLFSVSTMHDLLIACFDTDKKPNTTCALHSFQEIVAKTINSCFTHPFQFPARTNNEFTQLLNPTLIKCKGRISEIDVSNS